MTTNKRKRNAEGGETEKEEVNEPAVVAEEGVPLPLAKKPHNEAPSEIFTAAIEKIAELERFINEVAADEDNEYSSDYSDFSDVESGRFDSNSDNEEVAGDAGEDNINRVTHAQFNPEIVGFAICAQEAINFLRKEGFSEQSPLIVSLHNRLMDQLTDYQTALGEKKK